MSSQASFPDTEQEPASPPTVTPGEVINGKYRVERVIGEGGMGLVVAARHLTLDRSVALKLLNQRSRESKEALERFTREARAAARIQSEHVGRVLDVDFLPSGSPFIVMELLEGHDLAVELERNKKLAPAKAVEIVIQACEAIAEAHAAGIVHRDLKPANLFLSKAAATSTRGDVIVKVLDFGISKITRSENAEASTTANKALTNPTSMLGSPLYMSPEQMKASTEVDVRTDIWSLGVILYELVTGISPFDGKTIPMICAAVLSQPPPKIEGGIVPANLVLVINRCLEKEPDKRYRDVAHLVRALAPFAPEQAKITSERISKLRNEDGKLAASPATVPPPSFGKEGSLTVTSWDAKQPAAQKKKWVPVAVAGLLLAVVGGLAIVRLSFTPPKESAKDGQSVITQAPATTATASAEQAPKPQITSEISRPSASVAETASASDSSLASSSAIASGSTSVTTSSAGTQSTIGARPTVRPWQPYPPRTTVRSTTTATTKRTSGFGGRE